MCSLLRRTLDVPIGDAFISQHASDAAWHLRSSRSKTARYKLRQRCFEVFESPTTQHKSKVLSSPNAAAATIVRKCGLRWKVCR
jgi:hypothetical protein